MPAKSQELESRIRVSDRFHAENERRLCPTGYVSESMHCQRYGLAIMMLSAGEQ